MAELHTRRDVWKLGEWDSILLWYARAVAEMQRRPLNDPTSWRYQAAIHDYVAGEDPLEEPDDRLPSSADQERFWGQCQHFSWYFLPWHRMYLSMFEQIVAATVRQLSGPDDWALPYWNYNDTTNPNALRVPPAFRVETLPDGSANPLRVGVRSARANRGLEVTTARAVDLAGCLEERSFVSGPMGGAPGFGGPRTGFKHRRTRREDVVGDLESVPHGTVHNVVGGWMGAFNTAGLDPLFWLHHCNVDRVWSVWLGMERNPPNANPTDATWLTQQPFEFHDATGKVVRMTCSQVIDTTAPPLSYKYEDVSSQPVFVRESIPEGSEKSEMEEFSIPEMVGATEQAVTLEGEATSTSLSVRRPTGPAADRLESFPAAPRRVFLNIENVTSDGLPEVYAVYVNLPRGADPSANEELFAGVLPMFGVAEATDAARDHAGSGLNYSLEITKVVQTLEARNEWNPDELHVTFVPERPAPPPDADIDEAAAEPRVPATVGRVSLYYS
jgi:tyrosinase